MKHSCGDYNVPHTFQLVQSTCDSCSRQTRGPIIGRPTLSQTDVDLNAPSMQSSLDTSPQVQGICHTMSHESRDGRFINVNPGVNKDFSQRQLSVLLRSSVQEMTRYRTVGPVSVVELYDGVAPWSNRVLQQPTGAPTAQYQFAMVLGLEV